MILPRARRRIITESDEELDRVDSVTTASRKRARAINKESTRRLKARVTGFHVRLRLARGDRGALQHRLQTDGALSYPAYGSTSLMVDEPRGIG